MSLTSQLSMTLGEVILTDDPEQLGRIKVYCASIDPLLYTLKDLPWTNYASPWGGSLEGFVSGPNEESSEGPKAYGFWAIPKVGATVIVVVLNSDPNVRYYTHSIFPAQLNRSLPGGRGYDSSGNCGPFTDSHDACAYKDNLKEAGLDSGNEYKTRGGYERQVAQPKTHKDGSEGYSKNRSLKDGSLESNTYCFTTPGGHFLSLQDSPDFCRIRLRTVTGRQLLLDDTNERVYISTPKGNNYFEMDDDGHVSLYAKDDISFYSEGNINFTAKKDIFMKGQNINVKASKVINIDSTSDMNLKSGKNINLNASSNINIIGKSILGKASAELGLSGQLTAIQGVSGAHIGSPAIVVIKGGALSMQAAPAKVPSAPGSTSPADDPKIQPQKEPWTRPGTSGKRNKNYIG